VVDDRVGIEDADRVAVAGRVRAGARADVLRAARAVVDDQRLAPILADLLAHRAREDVAQAAGAGVGDDADRARRIVLNSLRRRRQPAARHHPHGRSTSAEPPSHRNLPRMIFLFIAHEPSWLFTSPPALAKSILPV